MMRDGCDSHAPDRAISDLHRPKIWRMLAALACAAALPLALAAGARADTVTTTITAGANPSAVAVNPVTNPVYDELLGAVA